MRGVCAGTGQALDKVAEVRAIISGIADLLDMDPVKLSRGAGFEVDDRFVGDGCGIPTDESREAIAYT